MGLKHELAHSPGCADLPHPDCMHLMLVLRKKKKKQMDINHTQEGISHSHGYTPARQGTAPCTTLGLHSLNTKAT
jgi:hypothetical protein